MASMFDTPGKKAVRETWNTPILRYLNQQYGFKYRYMGLPGVDLLDVKLWKDLIENVVAFELPCNPLPEDPHGRKHILELRKNLLMQQIPGDVYFGPMEEVILRGKDYDGIEYTHKKLITLCNLDFCDEISSPVSTRKAGEEVLRFQAINHIVTEQYHIYQKDHEHNFFIFLLTVRNQINAVRLRGYLSADLLEESGAYLGKCGGLNALPSTGFCMGDKTWALKAFIHDFLKKGFQSPRVSSLFFPIIKYSGNRIINGTSGIPSPMLHCMVFCRFNDDEHEPAPTSLPLDFLTQSPSIFAISPQQLVWQPEPGEPEKKNIKEPPSSLAWFNKYEAYFLKDIM
jgi:hypothetical protein